MLWIHMDPWILVASRSSKSVRLGGVAVLKLRSIRCSSRERVEISLELGSNAIASNSNKVKCFWSFIGKTSDPGLVLDRTWGAAILEVGVGSSGELEIEGADDCPIFWQQVFALQFPSQLLFQHSSTPLLPVFFFSSLPYHSIYFLLFFRFLIFFS